MWEVCEGFAGMTKFKEGDRVRYVMGSNIYIVRKQWMNHKTPMVTAKAEDSGWIGWFSADELEKIEEDES